MAAADSIPLGEARVYSVNNENVAVFRTRAGDFYAVSAECPHRAGPLADGLVGGTTVICPLHGWKFDLKTGEALFGDCSLKTFPLQIDEQGRIVLLSA